MYPEIVVSEWCPINGPDSVGVSEVHPWKQKTRAAVKAANTALLNLGLMLRSEYLE
jgi:hypothetical protein